MLLWDRIRYSTFAAQRNEFKGHVGMFYYETMSMLHLSGVAPGAAGRAACSTRAAISPTLRTTTGSSAWRTLASTVLLAPHRGLAVFHGVGIGIRVIKGSVSKPTVCKVGEGRAERINTKPGANHGEAKWA
ncbi:hypothetical protein IOCL2690_000712000 [Leishmania lindenbergi]|uniref:Uncharacterized protein n=1 Tax=Leishmania lindenbergi TaxID=651832 RepID=A0AAW2ZZ84_9TRYP